LWLSVCFKANTTTTVTWRSMPVFFMPGTRLNARATYVGLYFSWLSRDCCACIRYRRHHSTTKLHVLELVSISDTVIHRSAITTIKPINCVTLGFPTTTQQQQHWLDPVEPMAQYCCCCRCVPWSWSCDKAKRSTFETKAKALMSKTNGQGQGSRNLPRGCFGARHCLRVLTHHITVIVFVATPEELINVFVMMLMLCGQYCSVKLLCLIACCLCDGISVQMKMRLVFKCLFTVTLPVLTFHSHWTTQMHAKKATSHAPSRKTSYMVIATRSWSKHHILL